MEFIYTRIESKIKDFEKREQMLEFIENNPTKREKNKMRKPMLCVDLEKESKCKIYHSAASISPRKSPETGNKTLSSFQRSSSKKCYIYKTLEKYKLPEVFKRKYKGNKFSGLNSEKFLPTSQNEKLFSATRGLSITSFNKTGQVSSIHPRSYTYKKS